MKTEKTREINVFWISEQREQAFRKTHALLLFKDQAFRTGFSWTLGLLSAFCLTIPIQKLSMAPILECTFSFFEHSSTGKKMLKYKVIWIPSGFKVITGMMEVDREQFPSSILVMHILVGGPSFVHKILCKREMWHVSISH